MNLKLKVEALSPIFSYGQNRETPEIRSASIRGQLHQWFRLCGGGFEAEREVFGGIKTKQHPAGNRDSASRLVVRVSDLEIPGTIASEPTLPHKSGNHAAPKPCFPVGTHFTIHLTFRRSGSPENERLLERAARLWLLLGGFGTRANRCGGSLQLADTRFSSIEECHELIHSVHPLPAQERKFLYAILPTAYSSECSARRVATDTLGGPFNEGNAKAALSRLHYPLGAVGNRRDDPEAPRRKTSPLKLRLISFSDGLRIAAIWDLRQKITGNSIEDFKGIIGLLKRSGKSLGNELALAGWK